MSTLPHPSTLSHLPHPFTITCPKCRSPHIEPRKHAQRIGGAIGAISGATGIFSSASPGIRAIRYAALASPVASIGATVLGIFSSAAIGCLAGATLGQVIDNTLLDNYHCLHCRHSFSVSTPLSQEM